VKNPGSPIKAVTCGILVDVGGCPGARRNRGAPA